MELEKRSQRGAQMEAEMITLVIHTTNDNATINVYYCYD